MTVTTDVPTTSETTGLTEAEVADRVARGVVNGSSTGNVRPVRDIVRANVMTRFNAILAALLAVMLVGPLQDALFGVVLVLNTAIGIPTRRGRAHHPLDLLP